MKQAKPPPLKKSDTEEVQDFLSELGISTTARESSDAVSGEAEQTLAAPRVAGKSKRKQQSKPSTLPSPSSGAPPNEDFLTWLDTGKSNPVTTDKPSVSPPATTTPSKEPGKSSNTLTKPTQPSHSRDATPVPPSSSPGTTTVSPVLYPCPKYFAQLDAELRNTLPLNAKSRLGAWQLALDRHYAARKTRNSEGRRWSILSDEQTGDVSENERIELETVRAESPWLSGIARYVVRASGEENRWEKVAEELLLGIVRRFDGGLEVGDRGNASKPLTRRTISLLRGLLRHHDPELSNHLVREAGGGSGKPGAGVKSEDDWSRVFRPLFRFYGRAAETENEDADGVPEFLHLWDLAILAAVPGFDCPQRGSVYFALGMLLARRLEIMKCTAVEDVCELLTKTGDAILHSSRGERTEEEEEEAATDWKTCVKLGSRASILTPRTMNRYLGEREIDLWRYLSTVSMLPPPGLEWKEENERDEIEGEDVPASSSTKSSTTTTSKTTSKENKETDPTTLTYWSRLGQKVASEAHKALRSNEPVFTSSSNSSSSSSSFTKSRHPRKLYLVEFPGRRRLGLQLSSVRGLGLVVKGFDRQAGGGELGEAEEQGMVAKGDVIHGVNGVTVVSLPVNVAFKIISQQERPFIITFSTTRWRAPETHPRLPLDVVRMQRRILMPPLYRLYLVHGGMKKASKTGDILDLFAGGKEPALLRAVRKRYGECAAGDPELRLSANVAAIRAEEVLKGILIEDFQGKRKKKKKTTKNANKRKSVGGGGDVKTASGTGGYAKMMASLLSKAKWEADAEEEDEEELDEEADTENDTESDAILKRLGLRTEAEEGEPGAGFDAEGFRRARIENGLSEDEILDAVEEEEDADMDAVLDRRDRSEVIDVLVDARARGERYETGTFTFAIPFTFDDKEFELEALFARAEEARTRAAKRRARRHEGEEEEEDSGKARRTYVPVVGVRYCVFGSGLDRVFSMVEPSRAIREAERDAARVRATCDRLCERGAWGVCVVEGGFAELSRRTNVIYSSLSPSSSSSVSMGEGNEGRPYMIDVGEGVVRLAIEAYARLNTDDVASLARFASSYCAGFEDTETTRAREAVEMLPTWMTSSFSFASGSFLPLRSSPSAAGASDSGSTSKGHHHLLSEIAEVMKGGEQGGGRDEEAFSFSIEDV